ncbi:MAG: NADP-dependent phosphogluconate dehydrogenase [Candidatus Methylacidiphilales bacterium]
MAKQSFGIIGLAVMGENIALNIERNGFPIAVYNRTYAVTEKFLASRAAGKNVVGAKTLPEFVAALERPRRILIMVKAGAPVDAVMDELKPLLEPGDIVIDGGNSHYPDTERRAKAWEPTGLKFFGMGVSGGEEGALWGPSLMPGGDRQAYEDLKPILTKIAAQTDDGPCVTYIGNRSAGHFVKMVHNGIEYGDMQLIAESYALLKHLGGFSNAQLEEVFSEWNTGELSSFLIEITAKVINFKDDQGTGADLIDLILDQAGQKGTGKWTTQAALDLGVAIPTITAAVDARLLSARKAERVAAEKVYGRPAPEKVGDAKAFVDQVRAALYLSKICSYAQGMSLILESDTAFSYDLNLPEIARIWKAGCIIRAQFLDKITAAFRAEPKLPNLLMAPGFQKEMAARVGSLRETVAQAAHAGIAVPAMSASLAYFDAYTTARGPANLIQAQRDFFGAHTYQRIDREGTFHTEWTAKA